MKRFLLLLLTLSCLVSNGQMYRASSTPLSKTASYPKSKTYSTWNPLNKSANITLSVNNTVATSTSAVSDYQVRSTLFVHNEKIYFEIVPDRNTPSDPFFVVVGVSAQSELVTQYTGATNGVCMTTDGQKWINGSGSAYASAIADNDVIGVELDMTLGAGACTMVLYKNNVSLGTLVSNLTGPVWIGTGTYQTLGFSTVNFGASAFVYTGHTSFKQGLYTEN